MKTYRHPDTKVIRTVKDNDIQEAALKKLGYEVITAADIENEDKLAVTYQTVTPARQPATPPALPHLAVPVQPGPTRDTSAPVPEGSTGNANTAVKVEEKTPEKLGDPVLVVTEQPAAGITREDAQPLTGNKRG